jgi:signal transduction histidine kinase
LTDAVSDWLEERIRKPHGLETQVAVNGEKKRLDDNIKAILFRNIRELIINVVKHAQAGNVSVYFEYAHTYLKITVFDDGVGIDANSLIEKSATAGGFGLFSIEERMADLGGTLEIMSEPGKGFTAVLTLPLGQENMITGRSS